MSIHKNITRIKEVMGFTLENTIINFIVENKKLLNEQVKGIDQFIDKIVDHYPIFIEHPEWLDELKEFIKKSGCKKIEFVGFQYPASGAAIVTGVLINEKLLGGSLEYLLYVIFHEIAHQFQFKKYGVNIMYDMYNDETDINNAANYMYKIEIIADEFAARKIREFSKLGMIKKNYVVPSVYKNVPISSLIYFIKEIRTKLKEKHPEGNMSNEQIAEFLYNMIKSKTTDNN